MKRLFLALVLGCLVLVGHASAQLKDTPRVWEAPLAIPTYELNPPNPYPALLDWQRRKWRPVYPYPVRSKYRGTGDSTKAESFVPVESR